MAKFRIKELAQARGLTQEELARRSGVKVSTVQRAWQNKGHTEPRFSTLLLIARALGVTVDDLYTDDPAVFSTVNENQMSLAGVAS